MNPIEIITASAGTGKTYRLAKLLDEAIADGSARPEGVIATTFTRQAAAELQNRVRTRLLQSGRAQEAQALLAARIGTVNAICGNLVSDFTFELGLSPDLRVLDEDAAELELKRALASVVTEAEAEALASYQQRFDRQIDWHFEVRRIIEAARANDISADRLAACATRSKASLNECLGPVEDDAKALDDALCTAIASSLKALVEDGVGLTQTYRELLTEVQRDLRQQQARCGQWASLLSKDPSKKQLSAVAVVKAVAVRHVGHPRFRADMHDLIDRLFDVANRGMRAYQQHKQARGLLDYIDQEVEARRALALPEVQERLAGQIDLVMVDEFQDTSPLQLAIFLDLAKLAKRSVWVGDPKQAIFGFRGTDPKLMDAAIESLSSPSSDPDLVNAALEAVSRRAKVQTLPNARRGRKPLIDLTNALFVPAFVQQQQMPEERVRVIPVRAEHPELGQAVTHWPLLVKGTVSNAAYAHCVAAGIATWLEDPPLVFDPAREAPRPATAGDIAVLCRTNEHCATLSAALAEVGVSAVLARRGLMNTAEAHVLLAGLTLWVDDFDGLALATLLRVLDHPEDPDGFMAAVLEEGARQNLRNHPGVASIKQARAANPDADVLAALDAVMDALDLRRLCAQWGQAAQRLANLDAFRAHAASYCQQAIAAGDAPSTVGLLSFMEELRGGEGLWGTPARDSCARIGGDTAVTLSTWHASKGLEWPIVVLFGLDKAREAQSHGVHVMSDREAFDLDDPLGGRWIHYWPNPYSTAQQGGPVKEAYTRSPAHQYVADRATREALRVLYVGWTRARDHLVLAAPKGKLLSGALQRLVLANGLPLNEPPCGDQPTQTNVMWGGQKLAVQVSPQVKLDPKPTAPTTGTIRLGLSATTYPPARLSPSQAPERTCTFGEPVRLGEPLAVVPTGAVDALGDALHAFLAADDAHAPRQQRLQMAQGLLARFEVTDVLEPEAMLEAGARLRKWIETAFPQATHRREWPLGHRDAHGTTVAGTADLVVERADEVAIIDHKSPRSGIAAGKHAAAFGGQLWCYREVIVKLHPQKSVSTWVHLPLAGELVPIVFPAL